MTGCLLHSPHWRLSPKSPGMCPYQELVDAQSLSHDAGQFFINIFEWLIFCVKFVASCFNLYEQRIVTLNISFLRHLSSSFYLSIFCPFLGWQRGRKSLFFKLISFYEIIISANVGKLTILLFFLSCFFYLCFFLIFYHFNTTLFIQGCQLFLWGILILMLYFVFPNPS